MCYGAQGSINENLTVEQSLPSIRLLLHSAATAGEMESSIMAGVNTKVAAFM